jgi:hypothetical protein
MESWDLINKYLVIFLSPRQPSSAPRRRRFLLFSFHLLLASLWDQMEERKDGSGKRISVKHTPSVLGKKGMWVFPECHNF